MTQPNINRLMLFFLHACTLIGVLFLLSLYWTLPLILGGECSMEDAGYVISLICWYLGTLGALVLLFILTRMVKSLNGDPFVRQNVAYLRRMAYIAIIMSAFTFLSAVLNAFRPLLLLIGLMELFCAMLSLVLSRVFGQAVLFKEENELTI